MLDGGSVRAVCLGTTSMYDETPLVFRAASITKDMSPSKTITTLKLNTDKCFYPTHFAVVCRDAT